MTKLNLNDADQDALDAIDDLHGHAFEIVRYRDERGRFTSIDQLEEVPGMAGKITDQVRAQLTV